MTTMFTLIDHGEAALPERQALHGESLRGSRVSLVEVVVLIVGHFAAAVSFSEIKIRYVQPLTRINYLFTNSSGLKNFLQR